MTAYNKDASKTPSLLFDKSTHILKSECIKLVEKAKVFDQRTKNENKSHGKYLCCVWRVHLWSTSLAEDRWIAALLRRYKCKLSVRYSFFRGIRLKEKLVKEYQLPGLEGLLLSSRSKCNSNKQQTCCEDCFTSLTSARSESAADGDTEAANCNTAGPRPRKKSIANRFLCGQLPRQFVISGRYGGQHGTAMNTVTL